ncbi:squalene/phytoene synthase family protein [Candidatus Roizmanbacteria bacterium]|jgi:phytoene/squalene synthetase|nr:squalene/phytoene synthase family protein [Candidatus Roizmanbacteria bacterium]
MDNTTTLARTVTRKSSFQTYLIINLLVDRFLKDDCFKAYAYFRWFDDKIDLHCLTKKQRINFINRQKQLRQGYGNKKRSYLCPEEKMMIELMSNDRRRQKKLISFINNFFRIIEFDAYRKNKCIEKSELSWYAKTLSKAVTDGIEHFINHGTESPDSAEHYLAANAAHITHMLRDFKEDLEIGMINIPKEYLARWNIETTDFDSSAFRSWVKQRTVLARGYFRLGKQYIFRLPVFKRKLAACWYCNRFETVLDKIEKGGFMINRDYSRELKIINYFRMAKIAVLVTVKHIHYLLTKKV